MPELKKALKKRLAGCKKLAVLGIGSEFRADDAAGILVSEELKKSLKKSRKHFPVEVFFGGTAPENLTGQIKRSKPSHLIIVDTVDAGKRPGAVLLFNPEDVGAGASFSTHKMPAKILVDYLVRSSGCQATIIGIQPKTIDFGKNISASVKVAVKKVASTLAGIISR